MKKLSAIALLLAILLLASLTAVAAPQQGGVGVGEYTIDVDGTFQQSATSKRSIISVSIEWNAMVFNYDGGSKGTWNAVKHAYEGVVAGKWDVDMFPIEVTNHSNTAIDAVFTFQPANGLGIVGKFYALDSEGAYAELAASTLPLASAESTTLLGAPCSNAYFSVSGEGISYNGTIGIILVTISPQSGS